MAGKKRKDQHDAAHSGIRQNPAFAAPYGSAPPVSIFSVAENFSLLFFLECFPHYRLFKYLYCSSLKYRTQEVQYSLRLRHPQIAYSLFRIFLTMRLQWCYKCSSFSMMGLRKWEWWRQSLELHLWSMETRYSQLWLCRHFKVSRYSRITRCWLLMPRNRGMQALLLVLSLFFQKQRQNWVLCRVH